ncbi:MAG TPA: hypothetical protein VGK39_06845 [Cyclobacteriaceae bacterium]
MKKSFLLFSLLISGTAAMAQNKTLGVGVALPNPNAALHVESPTNNQGFIMPRLTSAQRIAMTGSLSGTDIGLMVYDTDLMGVYTWEGSQWDDESGLSSTITSTTGNAGYFAINNASNTGAALYATTNGSGVTSAAIIGETATAFSAITGRATGGAANGVSGISTDPGAGSYAILGTVSATGGGQAGVFNIANPSNGNNTLEATTNGTGGAAYFRVQNAASTRVALWSETNSNQPLTAAVYGLNTGTGDAAGVFRVNNASSNKQAVFAETNGSGSSVHGLNLGTGNGAYFRKNGSNAGTSSVWGDNYGNDGYAGIFQNISATNPKAALFAESLGPGPSIWANKDPSESGTSLDATHSGPDGSAGNFEILNAANTSASIFTSTTGSGPGIIAENDGTANGFAGLFQITQTSNTYPAIQATSKGTGSAIRAFRGATDGTGPGVDVFMYNTSSTAAGIMVDDQGLGDAGNFNINNASNSSATIRATTSGTGTALFANHTGASGNIAVFQNSNANVARIDKTGKGFFNGGTQASGADVAELFDVEGERNQYEPGDVLIISENTDRTVEKSNAPNSTKVAGVYATKPGVILTEKTIEENLDELVPMGVVGVIPTKVCLENGPIKRGDLLVTSSTTGHAMKAIPVVINGVEIFPTGAILGKALENFNSGDRGLIKVLVNVK